MCTPICVCVNGRREAARGARARYIHCRSGFIACERPTFISLLMNAVRPTCDGGGGIDSSLAGGISILGRNEEETDSRLLYMR